MKVRLGGVCLVATGLTVMLLNPSTVSTSADTLPPPSAERALLDRYCVTCHNQRVKTAGLMLDRMDLDLAPEGAAVWGRAVGEVGGGILRSAGRGRSRLASMRSCRFWKRASIARRWRRRIPGDRRFTV